MLASISLAKTGFSICIPTLLKYLTGIKALLYLIFSSLSATSSPLPTTIILKFSGLRYLLATLFTSSFETKLIFSIKVS